MIRVRRAQGMKRHAPKYRKVSPETTARSLAQATRMPYAKALRLVRDTITELEITRVVHVRDLGSWGISEFDSKMLVKYLTQEHKKEKKQ